MSCQNRAQLSLMWLYPSFRSVVVDILKRECWWHQSALRRVELSWFYQLLSHDRWIGLSEGKRDVPPCHLKREPFILVCLRGQWGRKLVSLLLITLCQMDWDLLTPLDLHQDFIYQCCILKQAYLEVRDMNDASSRSHLATAYNTLNALTATLKM